MTITEIPVITVSYNTPELINNLLTTFRVHYSNPYYIIDGSDAENLTKLKSIVAQFDNVYLIDFGYNIHHGPGMAWAIKNLPISGPVLFLDSDIEIIRPGFLEDLLKSLKPEMYGVGAVGCINRDGFNVDYSIDGIRYLHAICMLCNIEVMRQWPLPIKHGAPMTEAMLALHDSGASHLVQNIDWVMNDAVSGTQKIFIDHKGQGTVFKTGGYHLEEWMQKVQQQGTSHSEDQPVDLDNYNHHLLAIIPNTCTHVLEIGCRSGALAAAYKKMNPDCNYQGIALDVDSARTSRKVCNSVLNVDIESVGIEFFSKFSTVDCWILDTVLEDLKDPWALLTNISNILPENGVIVASISNGQHWSIQAKLGIGDFRYEDSGLMSRNHLRWFTRATLFEMLAQAGLQIIDGQSVILNEPFREKVIPAIRLMAESVGADPELAVNDALPIQYIIRATSAAKL